MSNFMNNLMIKNTQRQVNRDFAMEADTHYVSRDYMIFVIKIFVILCVAVFIIDPYTGYALTRIGVKSNDIIRENSFAVYRLFTCVFLHSGILHLVCNMIAIIYFGTRYERSAGRLNTLIILLATALSGSLASFAFTSANSIGASGVAFGLMGAFLSLNYINDRETRAKNVKFIVIYLIINLVNGFISGGIDNFAHIGGFVGGLLAGLALGAMNEYGRKRIRKAAAIGYGVFALALCIIGLFNIDIDTSIIYTSIINFVKDFISTQAA